MPGTIDLRFRTSSEQRPERPCLVSTLGPALERYSYGEMLRRAWAFGRHARACGATEGDRIVLHSGNSVNFVSAYFGTWLAGCVPVPVDPRTTPAHVTDVCRDCTARLLVSAEPMAAATVPAGVALAHLGEIDWSDDAELPARKVALPDDLAVIIYTSGTTGAPKGVCLSHRNLEHTRDSIMAWAQVTEADRELTTLSLTHLFGLAHLHVYTALGAVLYIADGVRDVPRLLDVIDGEDITSFPATPAGLKIIVDRFAEPLSVRARRLRYMIVNTAPLPVEYTRRLLALLPETRIYMYYGLTEASRSTYIAYRDHPDKLATVGRASPEVEVCVGDPAAPKRGENGEILVRGPNVAKGYWGGREAELFGADGWFRTGDLGQMDEEGFLTWLGRVREQINIDGLKVSPTEVEDVLKTIPNVNDCAVVGVPDPLSGESVIAFVVLGPDGDTIDETEIRRASARVLESYKVPRRIVFIDAIPRTASGKVRRTYLRDGLIQSSSG